MGYFSKCNSDHNEKWCSPCPLSTRTKANATKVNGIHEAKLASYILKKVTQNLGLPVSN